MKKYYLLLVTALMIFSSPFTRAESVLNVIVEAELLNVRSSRDTSSEIIDQLKRHKTIIAFTGRDENWYRVLYKGKTGYISSKHVKVLRVLQSKPLEDCNEPEIDLEHALSNFECKEGVISPNGYDECSIHIDVYATSNCLKPIEVYYDCKVNYEYTDVVSRGRQNKKSDSTNTFGDMVILNGQGKSFATSTWKPGGLSSIIDKTISVNVTKTSCYVKNAFVLE